MSDSSDPTDELDFNDMTFGHQGWDEVDPAGDESDDEYH